MRKKKRRPEPIRPDSGDEEPQGKSMAQNLIDDVARAIGKTAGRTREAISRLGERGAQAVMVRRLRQQRIERLEALGEIARKALSLPDGVLWRDDPAAAEAMQALDRIDEKLARMREKVGKGDPDEGSPGE